MKLRRISGTNVKGGSFSYGLADQQAIIGPNFGGKSAIIEAIRLCLIGYIPEVGKRPASTWELSSGPSMEVRVGLDERDAAISRRFFLDGSTVKVEAGFANLPSAEPFANLPLLNAEAYFQMTDSERTAYVFSMITLPDSYTPAAIIAECERISFEEQHSELVQKAKKGLIRDVEEAFEVPNVRGGDPSLSEEALSVQTALSDALDTFRDRFTYWNKRAKDTQGAVKTMTELKLRETGVVAAAQGVDRQIAEAQLKLDELNGEKGKLTAQQEEAERTATRMKVIQKLIEGPRQDYDAAIHKLRQRTVLLSPELLAFERTNLVKDIQRAKEHRAEVAGQVSEYNGILTRSKEEKNQLSVLTSCPYCRSTGEGWRETLHKELDLRLTQAKVALAEAMEMLPGIDGSLEKMEATLFEDDESVRKNVKLRLVQADAATQIKSLERDKASDETRRSELAAELAELKKRPAMKDLTEELESLKGKHSFVSNELVTMKRTKEAETQLQQDLKRASQAQLEHLDAAAHVLVIKAIANLLKEKREAMIEEAFGGLLKIANRVTDGILKSQLALHENTIGRWDWPGGHKFIPHRVFSGTEKALAYIAIAVALSSQAPLKLVILDEFGRLDEENQYKVLLRLSILVEEGVIDQFIVVGTSLPRQLKTSQVHLEVIQVKP